MSDLVLNDKPTEVLFSDSGYPLPIEKRPLWRLCLMCLCIKSFGRAETGLNITKLKISTWMLIRSQRWSEYIDSAYNDIKLNHSVGADYDTDRSIELGLRREFFALSGKNNIVLLQRGEELLDLCDEVGAFISEIDFIKTIKPKFTDAFIYKLMG
ncbi:hypothetical protein J4G62_05125 [Aeromonas caviae]|uniref:hypothetical protein n=1 Tax=Aeromonas caviae TaxID=648 RepID=UPI001BD6BE02|nr:hypothetical protein [Aeromonas caviae]MBS4719632.1 hypothetical protein [Aeromonas caviae]